VVSRNEREIVLKDATLKEISIPAGKIKTVQPSPISAMPDGILQNVTAQDAADLLEYLDTLK
jgi:hypothetical protein